MAGSTTRYKRPLAAVARGFTLVELLIVIVVIGILSSIILIGYSGVTVRADNARTTHYAEQWRNVISTYQANHSVLPNDWTCLGNDVSNFPLDQGGTIGTGVCEQNFFISDGSVWSSEYKTVPTPGQTQSTPAMLAANGAVANGTMPTLIEGSNYVRGIVYASVLGPAQAPNGQPGAYILYALNNQTCTVGVEYKVVGKIHGCAIKLTDDNYGKEIFDPVNPTY